MKTIETSKIINASADKVWKVLTDFESYPEWNPFIRQIEGKAVVGTQVEAHIQLPDQKSMIFKPTVLVSKPNREFRWLGSLWTKGIFDGEHYFILKPLGENRTEFIQGENFSGLLSGIFFRMIRENTRKGFEMMNEGLRERVAGN